jgi:hypothetical protein
MVQCALSVAAKQCCHLDVTEKEFVWLIVEHFNPVLGRWILSEFSGLSRKNRVVTLGCNMSF